ncbi:uncharacterized protein LOC130827611 isoform X2 [Amaranthus tricolor]|uniref:uncharacterized protein LOC130827611 isoform X2 n=1 Tax=Amaranthus tricolor TaxID=29722 RepID=UPI002582A908|nr:uncharacterized protein LOC130827611 isoform X2 [Amaranthus tricolor]
MNEVKNDKHYVSDIAYGGSGTGHIWAQPKNEESSAFYLDANFEKAFKIDDISSVFHYELINKNGGLNSCMTEGKDDIRCNDFDEMLHEVEMTNIPIAVSLSHASEDQLFDVDFAKKVPDLDCEFCDEVTAEDLKSEDHSPGTSNEEVGVSQSSILEPRCATPDEIDGDSGNKCYNRPVQNKMKLISLRTRECEIEAFQKTSDIHSGNTCAFGHDRKKNHFYLSSVKAPCTSICTNDEVDSVSQCTEVEDFCVDELSTDSCAETKTVTTRQRRLSRPPQRYVDGSPWLKSRLYRVKKHPPSLLKDEDLEVSSQKSWASNVELDSDEEYEPDSSCLNRNSMKRGDRRKNSKPWTLDEVVALVNGMSQFGTGQWTAVKRAFFSSSSRTATDIRDKWRNLVKTNSRSLRPRKDDHNKSSSQLLPKTLIERVKEIANNSPVRKSTSRRGKQLQDSRCSSIPPLAE